MYWPKKTSLVIIALAIIGGPAASAQAAVSCSDPASCTSLIQSLQAKFTQSQQQINKGKATANEYQQALQDLGTKIQTTQKQIGTTQQQISQVSKQIDNLTNEIAAETDHLEALQRDVGQEIRAMYESSHSSIVEILLMSPSFAQAAADIQNLQTIQNDIQAKAQETEQVKADLEAKKTNLQQQKDALSSLNASLTNSKKNLSSQTVQTNSLLNATQAQIKDYLATQAAIKQQIAETQRKLAALTAQTHWGSGIVSAPTASWTYNQLNYGETLGDSPYTVHDYGCFVTSMAMVTSFYGHHITPPQIANNSGFFDRHGYAYTEALANGIGLNIVQRSGIDWGTVDQELASGHPVIVSIYLPSVGTINSDGSSHFIVLQSKVGSTYLMQDPLGPDRSYDLKYIRSMFVLRAG